MIKTLYNKLYNNKDPDNKELLKGGVSAFSVRLIGYGFNYLFTFLVSRFYGPGGLGTLSIYQTVMQVFSGISKLGFNTLLLRYVAFFSAKNKWDLIKDLYYKSLKLTVLIGLISSTVLFFGSDIIAQKFLLKPTLGIYFRFGAFILLPWILMEIHNDAIRGMKLLFASSFLNQVLLFIIACLAFGISLFFPHNKFVPVVAYSVGMVVTAITSIFWWLKKAKLPQKIAEHVNFREMSGIAFILFSTTMLYMIRGWVETFLIGRYGTTGDLGVYKLALKIATITAVTLNALILSLQPKIAELHGKNDIKKLADIVQNSTAIIFWTSTPILLCFMLIPSFFMGLFGAPFKHGSTILMILTIGQFINAATGPVSNVLMLAGKHKESRNIVLVATLICSGLYFLLIPRYGILGAAWVNVIGFILFNVVPFFYVKYYFGFYTFSFKKIFLFRGIFHN